MSTPSSKEEAKKEEGAKAVKVAPPKPLLDALEEDDEFEEFEKISECLYARPWPPAAGDPGEKRGS